MANVLHCATPNNIWEGKQLVATGSMDSDEYRKVQSVENIKLLGRKRKMRESVTLS